MQKAAAEQIAKIMNSCISKMVETLNIAENGSSTDEYEAYKREIARIINTIDMKIMERIISEYPDLSPWRDSAQD